MGTENCLTCQLTAQRLSQPLCERIYEEEHWRVVHAYDTSLPGWLVIVAMRHVESMAGMSEAEAVSLGKLLRRVSQALQMVTGAIKTYCILFAEHPQHPHVHFHIVPRMADMREDKRGPRVFDYLGVPGDQIVPLEKRNEIAMELQELLLQPRKETL